MNYFLIIYINNYLSKRLIKVIKMNINNKIESLNIILKNGY